MSWLVFYMIVIFPLSLVVLLAMDFAETRAVPSERPRDRERDTSGRG